MSVYSVKIKDKHRGAFPFPRVYITKQEDKPLIDRMFRFYVGIPLISDLRLRFQACIDEVIEEFVEKVHTPTYAEVKFQTTLKTLVDEKLPNGKFKNELYLILPMRGTSHSNKEKDAEATPSYIGNKRWLEVDANGVPKHRPIDVFMEGAGKTFIHTPEKEVQPVCMACPMHVMHRAGMCQLGTQACLDNLPLASMSFYTSALEAAKKLPPTIVERDIDDDMEFVFNPEAEQ